MKHYLAIFLIACCTSQAEIAVIVHPSNDAAIDAEAVGRIYLGKTKTFPSGVAVIPISQSAGAAVDDFNSKVLGKSDSQLKAYWSQLIFTGKGTPPQEVGSDDEVVKLVAANPNFIGYVNAASASSGVKVVAKF